MCSSPEDGVCQHCLAKLQSESLKCVKCKGYSHLRCSQLPEHILLRFSISQASYQCNKCIEKEFIDDEKFLEASEKLKAIIQKEKEAIEAIEENDTTIDVLLSAMNGTTVTGDIATPEGNADETQRQPRATESTDNRAICKFYLRKNCQHGKSGLNCKYKHPKMCFKFLKHGGKSAGCKKGKQCEFLHPPLCWSSKQNGLCSIGNCRFFHLKGTKSKSNVGDEEQSSRRHDIHGGRTNLPPISHARNNNNNITPTNRSRIPPSNTPTYPQNLDIDSRIDNFLELKMQMKTIQEQLQFMMTAINSSERAGPRDHLWPPRQ